MCDESNQRIFVQVDKTVIKITGLSVRGLNTVELETLLQEHLQSMVRVIGVTGDRIEMDVYGVEEEDLLRDEAGVIRTVSLARGIRVSDITAMDKVEKIRAVPADKIPACSDGTCRAERWLQPDEACTDTAHGE